MNEKPVAGRRPAKSLGAGLPKNDDARHYEDEADEMSAAPRSMVKATPLSRSAMKRRLVAVVSALLAFAPLSVEAAEKTVVLDVKNADCVLCPPIVKQSLVRVPGVKTVEIKQADQMAPFMATITFDDAVANVPALIAATTNAGYPSGLAN